MYTGEYVYNRFIESGYLPLFQPSDYINCKEKLPFMCTKHDDKGILFISFDRFINKNAGCKYCGIEKRNVYKKYSKDFILDKFNEKQYILVSDNCNSVDDNLNFICKRHKDKGLQTTTFWSVLNYTNNCKYCRYEMQSGDLHYNWMGGLTTENESIRKSQQYENWRFSIFQRDDFTCKCCNIKGGNLNAHHIENFSSNEELRLDINNGITLCELCHSVNIPYSFHYIYGAFNNNKEQLEEYIRRYKNGEFNNLKIII